VSSIAEGARSSPRTRKILDSSTEQQEEHKNAKRVIEKLKIRKDNSANVAKRLIVGTVASGTAADEDSDDEMCDELQDDKEQWQMSDAVHMIKKDDIVVIRSVDTFNPYYLVKAMDEACELEEMFADDYGHTLPPNHTVVKGHYLEVQKRTKDGCFMFEDTTKVVAISAFCISGISPPLTTSKGIKKRKPITLYEISPEINDILLGLVTGCNI